MLVATARDSGGGNEVTDEDTVVGERLHDLGSWELYRFARRDSERVECTVALLPTGLDVAYGVYRATDAEPSASGNIVREPGAWSDAARESVLKEILAAYRPELPGLAAGFEFDLSSDPKDG
jgi:hypothetical protein